MHLIITPDRNTKKSDYTGAFKPEALAYQKKWGGTIVTFDASASMAKRKKAVLRAIEDAAKDSVIDHIAFFCHGWSSGIQAGFVNKEVTELAKALAEHGGADDGKVALYCCSTGSDPQDDSMAAPGTAKDDSGNPGDGSFADRLRDALCKEGYADCSVFAHRTAGHTTQNPNVIIFEGTGSLFGGYGGVMPITPKNKKAWAAWVKKLKTPYRFEVPYMTVAEIRESFEGVA
jgi:hypothetical protein